MFGFCFHSTTVTLFTQFQVQEYVQECFEIVFLFPFFCQFSHDLLLHIFQAANVP